MPYELHEIKQIRKNLGLTQTDLAKQSGVSQSLIAKIEAGKIDPTYTKTKKIFDTLIAISSQKETLAQDIMQKQIISVTPKSTIREAIDSMKRYEISQLPVIEGDRSIGIVSESIILDSLINKKGEIVGDIMEESAPVVSMQTTTKVISSLLKFFPMVLVSESGTLKGIITKADMIRSL